MLFSHDEAGRLTDMAHRSENHLVSVRYEYNRNGRVNPKTKQTDTQHSWYGWDGDRLVLSESQGTQQHTIYHPGSFVPLLRVEQMRAEDRHSTLAEKLERDAEVTFPPVLHQRLNIIEQELRKNQLSDDTLQFLSATGLKAENLALWLEPEPESDRQIHLYHCDHLGTPQALVSTAGSVDWHITLDPWGNVLGEHNPQRLHQPLRMQGQQYDEESGLHYNRHRYYDPTQGRYITQDPIGLAGGINLYNYTYNPTQNIDPLGLTGWVLGSDGGNKYCQGIGSAGIYLPQDEAEAVIRDNETMHNVYNPLSEYAYGMAVLPAIAGMAAINGTASIVDKSTACIEGVAKSWIVNKEKDPKKLMLTCTKSALNKGHSNLQGKLSDYIIDSLASYSQKQ